MIGTTAVAMIAIVAAAMIGTTAVAMIAIAVAAMIETIAVAMIVTAAAVMIGTIGMANPIVVTARRSTPARSCQSRRSALTGGILQRTTRRAPTRLRRSPRLRT